MSDDLHRRLRLDRKQRARDARRDASERTRQIYAYVSDAGTIGTMRARVHARLMQFGSGATCNEIAAALDLHPNYVSPRLTELEADGFAFRQGTRRSRITGFTNDLWHAHPPRQRQLALEGWL